MAYIGKQPVVGNFVKLDAIVTSATTTFNLLNGGVAYSPQSANNCIVSLNGIIQEPTSSGNVGGYTISGSTIVFTSALTTLDVIDFILVLGDTLSIGTPSDGTVSFAKVTSNLITGATSEATIAGGDSILIYDDSASALRKMTRTNFVSGVGGTNTPAFEAYLSSTQTVTNDTDVKIQFNTERFDTASCYDNATNYRFTPTTAGKYFCYTSVRGAPTSGLTTLEKLSAGFYLNGSSYGAQLRQDYRNSNGTLASVTVTTVIDFNGTTDYLEVFGNVDVNAGTPAFYSESTLFGAYKLIGV
jgi:hypothetical protein